MAEVILISPPWGELYGSYSNVAKVGVFYPPLGLCYLAASLKERGHSVKVIDAEVVSMAPEDVAKEVEGYRPEIVGITSVSPLINQVQEIARQIKDKLSIPIVLGGPHVTIVEEEALSSCKYFDFGVIGEGERTLCELVETLKDNPSEDNPNLSNIKGIIFRRTNGIINTGHREKELDLDSIPPPDRSVIDTNKYLWSVPKKGIIPLATILTTRGCPFKCIFCSQDKMYGNIVRFRSPQKVVDEMKDIIQTTPARHIIFCDDTLTLNRLFILEICNEILRRGLEVTWEGWTRANTVDEQILSLMKRAGLVRLSFGIESADEKVLKAANKGVDLDEIKKAYRIAKGLGLETRGSVIIGLPHETKRTVAKTIRFLRGLKELDHPYINIAMPYPGTKLRQMALNGQGGMKLLSSDYSELRRYDNAAIEVNDLKRKDLIRLQRIGLLLCYLTPRRIWHNITRAGWKAAFKNGQAFITSFITSFFKRHSHTENDNFQKRYWEEKINFFYRDYDEEVTKAYVLPKIKIIQDCIPIDKTTMVLDVGTGKGQFIHYFIEISNAMGADFSFSMLRQNPCLGRLVNANANNLPFADEVFNMSFAANLFHHVAHPQKVLKEMCRVSKKYVVIIEPNLLHLPMLLFLLIMKKERGGLRLTKRYIYSLAKKCNLRLIKFISTGLIYQNLTPAFLLRLLKFFDRQFVFGVYNLIIFEKER